MDVTSNHKKYLTKNPLKKYLIKKFQKKIVSVVQGLEVDCLVDVGCGEGFNILNLKEELDIDITGIDMNEQALQVAKEKLTDVTFIKGNIYNLPFSNNDFEVTLCTEVLEHLENPQDALKELVRVSQKYVVLSVPHEPYFQLGNLLTLNHLSNFGNHPEHINHWNPTTFKKLVEPFLKDVKIELSFPWIIVYGKVN